MNLYLFGVLIASRKHGTFAEIEGDVTCRSLVDAQYFVNDLANNIAKRTNDRSIFVVGIHVLEADRVKVPDYVQL